MAGPFFPRRLHDHPRTMRAGPRPNIPPIPRALVARRLYRNVAGTLALVAKPVVSQVEIPVAVKILARGARN
jgi:hypothetical protein